MSNKAKILEALLEISGGGENYIHPISFPLVADKITALFTLSDEEIDKGAESGLRFIDRKQEEHKEEFGVYADTCDKLGEWCEEYAKLLREGAKQLMKKLKN